MESWHLSNPSVIASNPRCSSGMTACDRGECTCDVESHETNFVHASFLLSFLLLAPHARVEPGAAGRKLFPLQSSLHCSLDSFAPRDPLTPLLVDFFAQARAGRCLARKRPSPSQAPTAVASAPPPAGAGVEPAGPGVSAATICTHQSVECCLCFPSEKLVAQSCEQARIIVSISFEEG